MVMKYFESDGSKARAVRTRAAVDVWGVWLATISDVDDNGVLPCSHPKNGGRLLLTARGAAAQMVHNDDVDGAQRLFLSAMGTYRGTFFVVIGHVSAGLQVIPGSGLCVRYNAALKKLLRETFVMKTVETLPTAVIVGHGLV